MLLDSDTSAASKHCLEPELVRFQMHQTGKWFTSDQLTGLRELRNCDRRRRIGSREQIVREKWHEVEQKTMRMVRPSD
jgi:hypothetical protein